MNYSRIVILLIVSCIIIKLISKTLPWPSRDKSVSSIFGIIGRTDIVDVVPVVQGPISMCPL